MADVKSEEMAAVEVVMNEDCHSGRFYIDTDTDGRRALTLKFASRPRDLTNSFTENRSATRAGKWV